MVHFSVTYSRKTYYFAFNRGIQLTHREDSSLWVIPPAYSEKIMSNEFSFQESHGIPVHQLNANLTSELVMRVGIPHRGGHLAFHAFERDYPTMVSANAFWNPTTKQFKWPVVSDLYETDFALDSGGYTALKLFQSKGTQPGIAGIFPWSYKQYVEFAAMQRSAWYSQPDLCCEREIAASQDEVTYRVKATATLLEGTLRTVFQWQCELANRGWSPVMIANQIKPPVPVLQGWCIEDYLLSLKLMKEVWARWSPWFSPPALIGLGSVCRRDLHHPKFGLYAILDALEAEVPKGSRLHLFGVKGAALKNIKMLDWIASADSMAYDYGARIKAHRMGFSNTLVHRADEMTRWMSIAQSHMQPSSGDQFRLSFV